MADATWLMLPQEARRATGESNSRPTERMDKWSADTPVVSYHEDGTASMPYRLVARTARLGWK